MKSFFEIICYVAPNDNCNTQWKIALTDSMIWPTIQHPRSFCMRSTLQAQYHHPYLCIYIECFAFDKCQSAKPSGPGHGLLSNQDIAGDPWEEVAVDLIGPWPTSTPHGILEFLTLTCIDTTTNLVKIAQIFDKISNYVATHFEHTWLICYPQPMRVIHENGGDFTGFAFKQMLDLLNIKPVPTTTKTGRLMPFASKYIRLLQLY